GPYLDNFPALVIDSILSYMATLPPEHMWNWDTFLRQLKPSNTWKPAKQSSEGDSTIARVSRLIKEMGKYRVDQVPTLKSL
ncbi:MAG TPA: hypothetical protein V6D17_14985, partial [Candidatus Obscuribacterales bacterium]